MVICLKRLIAERGGIFGSPSAQDDKGMRVHRLALWMLSACSGCGEAVSSFDSCLFSG